MIDDKILRRLNESPDIQAALDWDYAFDTLGPPRQRKQYGGVYLSDAQVEAIGKMHAETAALAPDDPKQQEITDRYNKIQEVLTAAAAAWSDITWRSA